MWKQVTNPKEVSVASIATMIQQSREVLTQRSVATFEKYENDGTLSDALVYVALAAAITGLFGLTGGISGLIGSILSTLLGFFIFTYLVYFIGKQQGGTGTINEVAYSFALFWAPLSVIFAVLTLVLILTIIGLLLVPIVGIVALVVQIYFAYLAVQSSMNLPAGGKIWMILIVAAIGSFIASLVIAAIASF
jgi:hypothetical protein